MALIKYMYEMCKDICEQSSHMLCNIMEVYHISFKINGHFRQGIYIIIIILFS